MTMAEELADTHAAEAPEIGSVEPAVIGSEPEKPLSLRETLNKSVETVREQERVRDEKGKFAKGEKPAAEIPATEKEVQPEPQASNPDGPPPGLSKKTQAIWGSLTPEARAERVEREAEVAKGFNEYRTKAQDIQQALEPVRHILQQSGIQNEAQAVKRLVEWESFIRSNPMQGIAQLARQYGVDLSQFAQRSDQPSNAGQEIPEHLRPVLDQFGQLSQTVNTLQTEIQTSRQEKIASELSTFAKDKPHFEKVRVAMGQMMAAGIVPATDLEGAYQRAVWADPDLREQLLREQDEKRKAEFAKTAVTTSARARQAAVSPGPRARQGAPMNGSDKGGRSVRETLMHSVNQLRDDQRA